MVNVTARVPVNNGDAVTGTRRRLILRSFQSPGDILMLMAAVRDLHAAAPGRFHTDVRTAAPALWENNPHVTPLRENDAGIEWLDMQYPLIHQSNQRPYHFLHGYAQFLEERLKVQIPVTQFRADIHLSAEERCMPPGTAQGVPERYWIVIAGGKYDFTAKWWDPSAYQKVVDQLQGRVTFVQCGEQGHWHPRLTGVVDLVGKTTTREFVRLMYHADGVLCPVTFAMHLAAAVETKPGRPKRRACVVVAGGREPPHWEAYPHHQFLSTNGALSCCADGGCWKSRCQLVGDGDEKDRHNLCEQPVQIQPDLRIPRCMHLITPEAVIRAIQLYYDGGALPYNSARTTVTPPVVEPPKVPLANTARTKNVLIEFRHGLGDAVQLTVVLKHLHHYHPDWNIDVASLVGKHSAYHGLCRHSLILHRDPVDHGRYQHIFRLDWHESHGTHSSWPSTKPTRCLREVFNLTPLPELCTYSIACGDEAKERARRYLDRLCPSSPRQDGRYPVVLLHYQGNTSGDKKDISHEVAREVCATARQAVAVPVVLDWDCRSPLCHGVSIHNPNADHELWGGAGTGDAEVLAALIEASALFVGVDSGPLHVAGATSTPTIGVWTRHHPVRYFDLAENLIHLVPGDHASLVGSGDALSFFEKQYRHRTYKELSIDLPALVEGMLTGEDVDSLANKRFLRQLSATGYGQRYYEEHRRAGLDYLNFGDWQQQYGRWFVESLGLRGKGVLDVGCACGSILRGLGQAGAIVQGVELNEYMVRLGREKWPDMAELLHTCDAVNLHLFEDGSWDAIHTAQVAEHWKPELVPFILK